MHEVAGILQSLLTGVKKGGGGEKKYEKMVVGDDRKKQGNEDENSSDAQWFFKFRELVSNHTF